MSYIDSALREQIKEEGILSLEVQKRHFRYWSIKDLRNWLQDNGIDRNLPIEFNSTEIALLCPKGIILQKRYRNNRLGVWGKVLRTGEEPLLGAVRALREETNLSVGFTEFEFVENCEHDHTYANGDVAHFHVSRFCVKVDKTPFIGAEIQIIKKKSDLFEKVLDSQKEFVSKYLI